MSDKKDITLGFIGFGELAQGLAKGLKSEGLAKIKTFDKAIAEGAEAGKKMLDRRRGDGRDRRRAPWRS